MCYDAKAEPPLPPGAPGPASGEDLVLSAEDGNRFAAYFAQPTSETAASAQVIIYPDVRGLHQFYKDLALRFAETGIEAIALDYFGRTAGLTERDDKFEFWPHVGQMQLTSFTSDVKAAAAYLKDKPGASGGVFVVGFCMGGSMTLLTATNPEFGFAGVVPFYAGLSREFGGAGTVLDNASKVEYPVLGLFGGADQGIPQDQVRQLEETLDGIGIEHDITIYPGAPHGFFDRRATEFADASADAWQKVLTFIESHRQAA